MCSDRDTQNSVIPSGSHKWFNIGAAFAGLGWRGLGSRSRGALAEGLGDIISQISGVSVPINSTLQLQYDKVF